MAEPSREVHLAIVVFSAITIAVLVTFAIQTHLERRTSAITREVFSWKVMAAIWAVAALMLFPAISYGMKL